MEMEGLINVKSDVQREIKLLAGVFNQQNETEGECPIYLKININGDKIRFPVKRHILPDKCDSNRARMKGRTKEAIIYL